MIFTYDGTYDGLLSVIFESYRLKAEVAAIVPADRYQEQLFSTPIFVAGRNDWAERVRKGLIRRGGERAEELVYHAFLSEQPDNELLIFRFIRKVMASADNPVENYADPDVLRLHQLSKQIGREVHRMHAFVRFQETRDGLYVALIMPDFNVIPLLGPHFMARYPAQAWLIYDTRRHYGIHWDRNKLAYVAFPESEHQQLRQLSSDLLTTDEEGYKELWRTYFRTVDIPERRNMKVHLQHVPRRYWKYLIEKQDKGGR